MLGARNPPLENWKLAWQEDGEVEGVVHRKGQKKRTWEVIRDQSKGDGGFPHSYDLEKFHPAFRREED